MIRLSEKFQDRVCKCAFFMFKLTPTDINNDFLVFWTFKWDKHKTTLLQIMRSNREYSLAHVFCRDNPFMHIMQSLLSLLPLILSTIHGYHLLFDQGTSLGCPWAYLLCFTCGLWVFSFCGTVISSYIFLSLCSLNDLLNFCRVVPFEKISLSFQSCTLHQNKKAFCYSLTTAHCASKTNISDIFSQKSYLKWEGHVSLHNALCGKVNT